jgi:hypothetical protein
MKKLFTIIFCAAFVSPVFAQNPMPNSSFENWYTGKYGWLDPTGCDTTSNTSNYDGADYADASVVRITNAHSGSYALECINSPSVNNGGQYFGGACEYTFPVSFQPVSFSGWWIVNEGTSIFGEGVITVQVYDSVTGNFLGGTKLTTGDNNNVWTTYRQFSSDINYDSTAKKYLCVVDMYLDDAELDNVPYVAFDDIAISATSGLSVLLGNTNYGLQVYPNPVNNKAELEYNLQSSGNVLITLTDMLGRTVKTIKNESDSPGNYVLNVDLSDVSEGMYLCRLSTPAGYEVKKVLVTR